MTDLNKPSEVLSKAADLIDLSKIKPGDEVTVRGVVSDVADRYDGERNRVRVDLADGEGYCYVGAGGIVSHTPKPLSVGDRVKKRTLDLDVLTDAQRIYTITAIDEDGWMLLADRGRSSRVMASREIVERAV